MAVMTARPIRPAAPATTRRMSDIGVLLFTHVIGAEAAIR
jgi:hypothetical protein